MPSGTEPVASSVDRWLAQFERALGAGDSAGLRTLFHPDAYWRDVLALTWGIRTVSGREAVLRALEADGRRAAPAHFAPAVHRTPPREVTRAGTRAIEAIFSFDTPVGPGSGVLRLVPDGGTLKAWTFLTALDGLTGHEEQIGKQRPKGESYSRDFRGPN